MNKFEKARRTMQKALAEDEGLRVGYEANIAMLLVDLYKVKMRDANRAAIDILKLVFN